MKTSSKCLVVLGSALPLFVPAVFGQIYQQDFSQDTDGIVPRQFESDTVSNLNRVASGEGNLGVLSYASDFHLEVGLINENEQTAFGYGAGGYDDAPVGAFESGLSISFRAYLDNPNRPLGDTGNAYEPGDGWFFQPTLHRPDGAPPISAGGFGIQLSEDREWSIAATGNALGGFEYGVHNQAHPQHDDAVFALGDTFTTGTEGWYRMQTTWISNGLGGVDQLNTVYDPNGVLVFSATIENAVADIADAGYLGPIWLGQDGPREPNETGYSGNIVPSSGMGDLAIDDIIIVPEPATVATAFGLLSMAVVFAVRRRKRAGGPQTAS